MLKTSNLLLKIVQDRFFTVYVGTRKKIFLENVELLNNRGRTMYFGIFFKKLKTEPFISSFLNVQ